MHILRSDELLRIHEAVLERFGGLQPKGAASEAERGKAESLVDSIRTAMTYNTAYNWDNVYLCAAMHAQCIARAHAFSDGNKRTALNAAGLLLRRAGCRLKDSEKLPFLLVELAQSELPVTDVADRLKALMAESEDAANMEEPMNDLSYFRIPP